MSDEKRAALNEELSGMTLDDVVARLAQLDEETRNTEDIEKVKENTEIKKELLARKAELEALEKRNADVHELKQGATAETVEERNENTMANIEVRNTLEYIEQYAEYIKSGEMRGTLLTENATNGTVPVPEMVYDIVKTAWEKEGIMSLVKKTFVKGNLKVGFEISATGAVVHTEGGDAVTAETLTLGIVSLVPESIKKWVPVSDEILDMRGEAFLNYIYNELAYQIAKKAADEVVAKIEACGTQSTTTCVGVPKITATTIQQATVASAIGLLSDEAANPVVMMNKATWAKFKAVQYSGNFSVDPFEGLPVVFNNTIKSFDAATTGETYAIVGDLGHGALANFPNGQEITFKFDDMSDMTKDVVRVLGREYIGLGVVAPQAFVKVVK